MTRKTRVPHPGWACCDLEQDLAAWIARQRALCDAKRAQARPYRRAGERAKRLAIAKDVADRYDWRSQMRLTQLEQHFHGIANGIMQSVLITEGHVERVEAAHAWRLT
jgi:hypothetical protein